MLHRVRDAPTGEQAELLQALRQRKRDKDQRDIEELREDLAASPRGPERNLMRSVATRQGRFEFRA